ncbi:MAG: hypothetical protein Q9204_000660 [Flavoplaca sp. TL-2023a]
MAPQKNGSQSPSAGNPSNNSNDNQSRSQEEYSGSHFPGQIGQYPHAPRYPIDRMPITYPAPVGYTPWVPPPPPPSARQFPPPLASVLSYARSNPDALAQPLPTAFGYGPTYGPTYGFGAPQAPAAGMPYGYQPPPPGVPQGYHYQTPGFGATQSPAAGMPYGYQLPPPGVPQGYHHQTPGPSFPPPTSAFAPAPPPPPANTPSTRPPPSATKNKQTGTGQSASEVPLSVLKEIRQHPKYDPKFSVIQNLKFFAWKERLVEKKVRKQKGVGKVPSARTLRRQAYLDKRKEQKKEEKAKKKADAEVKVKVEEEEEEEDEVKEEEMEEEEFEDEEVKEEEEELEDENEDDEEEGKFVIKQEP